SSSRITPEIVARANTSARNPTATQNSRSDLHQPAIRSVATTEVAQPLMMLTAAAATAVVRLGSPYGLRGIAGDRLGGAYCGGDGARGVCVGRASSTACGKGPGGGARGRCGVRASSAACGKGPVGARRMMRVV